MATPKHLLFTIMALAACGRSDVVVWVTTTSEGSDTDTSSGGASGTSTTAETMGTGDFDMGGGDSGGATDSQGSSGSTGGQPHPCKDDLESVAATPGNGCCMYPNNLGIESSFTCVDRAGGDYTQEDCDEIQGVWFTGRCADRPGSGGSFDWTFNGMEWIGTSSLGCVDAVAVGDFIDVRAHSVGPASREDLKMLHGVDDWWPNPDTCITDPEC